ncbi:MAG: ytpA [Nocardioides sp.]|jgi:alpha-beta hydrolase superfamily lysophospholipase|uniref:alpha/beta hydrolase n=1 Tax=Nocardioides sp. TaxID=35761 RepID=UPI002630E3C7|nr:alpha/beta hydrolase [Nocardioides sp.]MCW2835126.1 ytpA [Nocardioides sp.]
MTDAFDTDVLGAPYTQQTLDLGTDSEGEVVATLVHLAATVPTGRAVLHVHGFADYFFHTEYAEWWAARGYDFYAVDLRKYGRSLREHQTPNYVEDLTEYYEDLDAAWAVITADHTSVLATAHSTGGLTLPLWLHERQPPELAGVLLNSPWLDMQGAAWLRSLPGRAALDQIGVRQPRRVIPRTVSGYYTRSLHRDHDGEFDFNLEWKPMQSWPVYAGWLRAVRQGHSKIHRGLDIAAPTLVLSSSRTAYPSEMGEDVHTSDVVLDVRQIRRWASSLGPHVTSIGIEGARHDVVLSLPDVRAQVYAEIDRWLAAYVEDD